MSTSESIALSKRRERIRGKTSPSESDSTGTPTCGAMLGTEVGYVEDEGLLDVDGAVVVLSSAVDSMGVPTCGAVLGT